jgi:hypothetical protein
MKKIRCSVGYHVAKLDVIPVFAAGVRDGIYNNIVPFAMPPMLIAIFQALIDDYINKRAAYKQGGLAQKGPFLVAKQNLMIGLDRMSEYVDTVANGDANVITLSGFVPTKGTTTEVPAPAQPTGVKVARGTTGILLAECDKQAQAVSYGCIMTTGAALPDSVIMNGKGQLVISSPDSPGTGPSVPLGPPASLVGSVDLNQNRKKEFLNLEPGTTYYFVFFAVNASGVSPLSISASLMCG